jgi:hypothetical protein
MAMMIAPPSPNRLTFNRPYNVISEAGNEVVAEKFPKTYFSNYIWTKLFVSGINVERWTEISNPVEMTSRQQSPVIYDRDPVSDKDAADR